MGEEVAILTISLFVGGYCIGPLFWGPLSEQVKYHLPYRNINSGQDTYSDVISQYGRKPIFVIAFIFYTGFQVGCALSPNTASILIFRLLGGMFAAAPLTNSG